MDGDLGCDEVADGGGCLGGSCWAGLAGGVGLLKVPAGTASSGDSRCEQLQQQRRAEEYEVKVKVTFEMRVMGKLQPANSSAHANWVQGILCFPSLEHGAKSPHVRP
eukprot:1150802-Pelagomonas_calceolata.AAC.3